MPTAATLTRTFRTTCARARRQVRCRCKHAHTDHSVAQPGRPCRKVVGGKPCACAGFDSPYVCTCNLGWADHSTQFRAVEVPAAALADAGSGLSEAEARAIAEMAVLPTAASAALTLNDVMRGRDEWAERGSAGGSGAVGESADARHVMAAAQPTAPPPSALASLKRRAGAGAQTPSAAQAGGQPSPPPRPQAQGPKPEAAAAGGAPAAVSVSLLQVGQQLEAQFSNGLWYRATVTRVLSTKGEGRVAVRFDDDGVVDDSLTAARLRLVPL